MPISYKTAESVRAGHPDKLCDLIADGILDACIRKDQASRVACEVMATKGRIIVAGEITCKGKVDIRKIVHDTLRTVGYNPWDFITYVFVHMQSADISAGVSVPLEMREGQEDACDSLGAGDQGTVYGYATDETPEMLPLPLVLSHRIVKRLDECCKYKLISGLGPDGKAQVTVEYEDGKPKRIKAVVISVQHTEEKTQEQLREDVRSNVLLPCFEEFPLDQNTEILVNPSGRFVEGGPAADTGLTGRKLMVDTYGGLASHGGGALSGKDPTKVDRSGAYMARYIAKNIVWSGLAKECEVALSYAIGKANPVAVDVNTFGTGKIPTDALRAIISEVFDLRPAAIIRTLRLQRPIFADTAIYGHFSNALSPCELTDKSKELKEAAEQYADRNA